MLYVIRSELNVPCFDAFERNVFEKVRKHFFDRILRGIVGRKEREREIDKEEEGRRRSRNGNFWKCNNFCFEV